MLFRSVIKCINEKDSQRVWTNAKSSITPYCEVERLIELEYSSIDKVRAIQPTALATGREAVVMLKSLRYILHHFSKSEKTWFNMSWDGLLSTQLNNQQQNRVWFPFTMKNCNVPAQDFPQLPLFLRPVRVGSNQHS